MARRCTVCENAERAKIELGLARLVPLRTLSQKFGPSKEALSRHKANHMPPQLVAALMEAKRPSEIDLEKLKLSESEGLLQNLVAQRAHLYALCDQAEEMGDIRACAQLHSRLTSNLELTAKLLGELRVNNQTLVQNVLISAEYHELRSTLVAALRPFPDARAAVAAVLRTVETRSLAAPADATTPAA